MPVLLLLAFFACGGDSGSTAPAPAPAPVAAAPAAAPAAPAAAADCCCGLNPTDVGEITYERMAPDVCQKGGPDGVYDGGACVEDARCAAAAAAAVCCCGLNPTDVGEMVYEKLAPAVCQQGGPERRYDGGSCVEDINCR